jgi:hypothetical protein
MPQLKRDRTDVFVVCQLMCARAARIAALPPDSRRGLPTTVEQYDQLLTRSVR